ncbi:kinetochore protein NDC80 homolog [Apium graveolens]|uniref:kinetochore protein NDC80 homolog n=1 Tax=Apium graveolens TaxID=4045 RepID=UPI003D7C014E
MRSAGIRRQKDSFAGDHRKPPPPTPTSQDPFQYNYSQRDSDASLCSSRPSIASTTRNPSIPISDKSFQLSAIRTINLYLSSHSANFTLKPPLPSAKDIIETLKLILKNLDFPVTGSSKLEDDLFSVLKVLGCPIKLNRSALKAPGTPHSWPSLLGVMHWLVQIGNYDEVTREAGLEYEDNGMFDFSLRSYYYYISGDDERMESEDAVFVEKVTNERNVVQENANALVEKVRELEGKLERLKNGPSQKEALEEQRKMLEEDVKKFYTMIEQLDGHIVNVQKTLEDKEKELEAKAVERKRICEENEELKSRVEEQGFNARDAERMKRELQAVERSTGDAEAERNSWEEKSWELDAEIGKKFKELESLMIECNQAIRKLKLGNGFHYELNAKGSTPAEVLGIDYKSKLKPVLASLAEETKKNSMVNLEEQISLQKLSVEAASKIEAKRNQIAALQSHIDEVENQLNLLKDGTQEHISRCMMEARKLVEDIEAEEQNMDVVEKEATELLRTSQMKCEEVTAQSEEEVQMCAGELLSLIDSVSKFKESMTSTILDMKNDYIKTVNAISEIHKSSL